jgi:hypothetical protein
MNRIIVKHALTICALAHIPMSSLTVANTSTEPQTGQINGTGLKVKFA